MLVHIAAGTQDKIALVFASPLSQVTLWLVLIYSLTCFYFLQHGQCFKQSQQEH